MHPFNPIVPLLAAALLLLSTTASSAERTGKADVGDVEVVLPLPPDYIQATLDLPAYLRALEKQAAGHGRLIDVLIAAECIGRDIPFGPMCLTTYELYRMPDVGVPLQQWPALRRGLMTMMAGDTSAIRADVLEAKRRNPNIQPRDVEVSEDTREAMQLLAVDDPRSVRFRTRSPAHIADRVDGERLQWRFGATFPMHGQVFNVTITREFAVGADSAAIVAEMEAELDAFLIRLYALNPMYEER